MRHGSIQEKRWWNNYKKNERMELCERYRKIRRAFPLPQRTVLCYIERRLSKHEAQDHSIPETLWYK